MDYTVLDLEMTGLAVKKDKIIEIGAVRVRGGRVTDTYGTLVASKMPIPAHITELTGITDEMAAAGMEEDAAVQRLLDFVGEDVLVGHNVNFDYSFVKQWAVNHRIPLALSACDTLRIARGLLPPEQPKKLEDLCVYFGIRRENGHRALDDALETQQIFEALRTLGAGKPELFVPRPLRFETKRQTPATAHQKERLKTLMGQYGITEPVCWETLTRSEASRMEDRIRTKRAQAGSE